MKAVKSFFLVAFAIVCSLYVFIVVSTRLFPNFYPFGIRIAIVSTDSMSPVLKKDDFVVIKKVSELHKDDIVVFTEESTGNEVIHRIVEINDDYVVTKGDSNVNEDSPIHKERINGIFLWKSSLVGNIISYMMNPYVFSILFTTFLIVIVWPSQNEENNKNVS